jgi:hypothetical protein
MNAPSANAAAASQHSAPLHPQPHPAPQKINLWIDDRKYVVTEGALTGRELKSLAGIPEANQLFLEVPGPGDDEQVFDDSPFKLKSGMKFYDVPVGNLGRR